MSQSAPLLGRQSLGAARQRNSTMRGSESREPLNSQPSSTRFQAAERMEGSKKKRVLVVGAGAAGKKRETVIHLTTQMG